MKTDIFDKIHLLLFGLVLILLGALLVGGGSGSSAPAGVDRAVERDLAAQARLAFLKRLYAPAEDLAVRGDLQAALLKLDELERQYPGEPHGHILQGEVMHRLGALEQAVSHYAAAIRLNGAYIDRNGIFSHRADITRVVEEGEHALPARAQANPKNRELQQALNELHYLRSRLAGGCE